MCGPLCVFAGYGEKICATGERRQAACSEGAPRGRWAPPFEEVTCEQAGTVGRVVRIALVGYQGNAFRASVEALHEGT